MTNEFIITELKKELEFLSDNYQVPLDTLYKLVDMLSERLEITTPFSDDLGNETNEYYPRELGEVEDVFNVEINGHGDNNITLTRRVIRASDDDGSYLQSMVSLLGKLKIK